MRIDTIIKVFLLLGVIRSVFSNVELAGFEEALESEFPYHVALYYEKEFEKDEHKWPPPFEEDDSMFEFGYQFFCAGTLIDSRTVLTASHCVRNFNKENMRWWVVLGRNEVDYEMRGIPSNPLSVEYDPTHHFEDGIIIRVEDVKIYLVEDEEEEDYITAELHDIGVVYLSKDLNDVLASNHHLIGRIKNAELCEEVISHETMGPMLIIPGYGLQPEDYDDFFLPPGLIPSSLLSPSEPRSLKKIKIQSIPWIGYCEMKQHELYIQSSGWEKFLMCAGDGLKSGCKGDNGGGIFLEDDPSKLVGIFLHFKFDGRKMPFEVGCGDPGYNIGARMSYFANWIKENSIGSEIIIIYSPRQPIILLVVFFSVAAVILVSILLIVFLVVWVFNYKKRKKKENNVELNISPFS